MEHAFVQIVPSELLLHRIGISELTIEQPDVRLAWRGDQSNIATAIASKNEEPGKPTAAAPDFVLRIGAIHMHDGRVVIDASNPVAIEKLNLDGDLKGSLAGADFRVSITGRVERPLKRDATIIIAGACERTGCRIDSLSVRTGHTTLKLVGAAQFSPPSGEVRLDELHLDAADLNAAIPSAHLREDVSATGHVSLRGDKASATLQAAAPAGHIQVTIEAALANGLNIARYDAQLKSVATDLQQLRDGMPRVTVNGTAHIQGAGLPFQGATDVETDLAGSRVNGISIDHARNRRARERHERRFPRSWHRCRRNGVAGQRTHGLCEHGFVRGRRCSRYSAFQVDPASPRFDTGHRWFFTNHSSHLRTLWLARYYVAGNVAADCAGRTPY